MIFDKSLLYKHGATLETYASNQLIFSESETPKYYFQIEDGIVELNNYTLDGKEFTQNILSVGESIGESFLFGNKPYPMNGYAKTECRIFKLSKIAFLTIVNQDADISRNVIKSLSDTLYQNYLKLFSLSSTDPANKIKTLLDDLRGNDSKAQKYTLQIPWTRQQLANLTGLRVETVIRSIKKMERENILKIKNGKILY
jgi:CRP-like cAMP-binding protein